MTSLDGRVALITGGGNGIGRACAERFARDGAKVAVADIVGAEGQGVASALRDAGHEAVFLQCDVTSSAEVRATVEGTLGAFGAIDILVNNAAIIKGIDFLEISEADFDAVLNVNLRGAFLVAQAVARQMVTQVKAGRRPGSIINMSSVNAVFAIANQVPYSVSKGGLNQLTKVMALSLAEHGIRVNAIGPGSINTRILQDRDDRCGGPHQAPVAHAARAHRRAGGNRRGRRLPRFRRCELHHRPDHLCRWRPAAAQLHGAGEERPVKTGRSRPPLQPTVITVPVIAPSMLLT